MSSSIDMFTDGFVGYVAQRAQHPAPWWFRLLNRFFPDRCREIPEATDPSRVVLRQFAIWKRYIYLQQFAGSENIEWYHSHQWRRTFAIGLWGSYTESRLNITRRIQAPYFYTMGPDVIHQVTVPSPGHTSIFIGLWRNDDLKQYFRINLDGVLWSDHIKVFVKRI